MAILDNSTPSFQRKTQYRGQRRPMEGRSPLREQDYLRPRTADRG